MTYEQANAALTGIFGDLARYGLRSDIRRLVPEIDLTLKELKRFGMAAQSVGELELLNRVTGVEIPRLETLRRVLLGIHLIRGDEVIIENFVRTSIPEIRAEIEARFPGKYTALMDYLQGSTGVGSAAAMAWPAAAVILGAMVLALGAAALGISFWLKKMRMEMPASRDAIRAGSEAMEAMAGSLALIMPLLAVGGLGYLAWKLLSPAR